MSKMMKLLPAALVVTLITGCNLTGKEAAVEAKKAAPAAPAHVALFEKSIDPTEVEGTTLYLLPEDDEPNEDGLVDQYWMTDAIATGTVPAGIQLVDVRKAEKFNAEHIDGAINIPFDMDAGTMDMSKIPSEGVVVFYCNAGIASMEARSAIEDEELLERVFVMDATYKCDKETHKNCKLTPNEAI
jgi:rhodanese-related sulfurtransferase